MRLRNVYHLSTYSNTAHTHTQHYIHTAQHTDHANACKNRLIFVDNISGKGWYEDTHRVMAHFFLVISIAHYDGLRESGGDGQGDKSGREMRGGRGMRRMP